MPRSRRLLLAFLLFFAPLRSAADDRPARIPDQAQAWLAHVRACQKAVFSLEADFTQEIIRPGGPDAEIQTGAIKLRRKGRVRVDYAAPSRRSVVSDGVTLWVYDPAIAQVVLTRADQSILMALFDLFLRDDAPVRFTASYLDGRETAGRQTAVVELVPARPDPFVASVLLTLEDRCPAVARVLVLDHAGSVTRVTLQSPRTNVGLGSDLFRFTPPANVRIVRP